MEKYISSDKVIGIVYSLLTSINIPIYVRTKPTKAADDEYIVINTLAINADVLQSCRVNVNYHCKDLYVDDMGYVPDMANLDSNTNTIINLLKRYTGSGTHTYTIDFIGQETFSEENINEHFSNVKFKFNYINK
jgi:hypothetical protein